MRVKRVLNNNAVMVTEPDGGVAIVLGRAIGYGKRPGDGIESGKVTERFVPDQITPLDRLAALLTDTPLEVVRIAREVTEAASAELGIRSTQSLILPIADHLAFAIARAREGIHLDQHPLHWEVSQLYPRELGLGRDAVDLARRHLGAGLDDAEAVPLALHFVNAQFSGPGMAPTIEMTKKIARIIGVIESTAGVTVDRESMGAARFVTHLRYLFVRLQSRSQYADEHNAIRDAIELAHPEAYQCAERLRYVLTTDGESLSNGEVTYLALHIARLLQEGRGGPGSPKPS